jgi:hypothetical protein
MAQVTTTANTAAAQLAEINRIYSGLKSPAKKAAFQRKLSEAGLPNATPLSKKSVSETAGLIAGLKAMTK